MKYESNTLQHHGILGMKWGVRRYQRKDGTLTNAGKKRYDKEMAEVKAESKRLKEAERTRAKLDKLSAMKADVEARKRALDGDDDLPKKDKQKVESKQKKSIKDMTDEEIQAKIDRLNLENKYKELLSSKPSETNANDKRTGREYVHDIVRKIGQNTLENIGTQAANHVLGAIINKAAGVDSSDKDNRIVNPQKGQADKK